MGYQSSIIRLANSSNRNISYRGSKTRELSRGEHCVPEVVTRSHTPSQPPPPAQCLRQEAKTGLTWADQTWPDLSRREMTQTKLTALTLINDNNTHNT